MADKKTYVLKPMKGLTAWTRGLAAAYVLALAIYAVAIVYAMAAGAGDTTDLIIGLAALFYIGTLIPSCIVSLCWIYGAARNARALKPGLTLSPGWAVGWFFVPFANIYKPMTVVRDIWSASAAQTPGVRAEPPGLIATWWWLNILGNVALNVGNRLSKSDDFSLSIPDIMTVAGIVLVLAATLAFRQLVKLINDRQKSADVRVAETF